MAELPVLYSFRRCPYAMRARLAIAISGQSCELREVVLRDKPQQLRDVSPKATVPVLVDTDGTVLEQSLDIMYWALQRHDPQGWLAHDAQALIAECDGPFKQHLDRYKYPERHPGADALEHRCAGTRFVQRLDAQLAKTPQLSGTHAGLADMAIAPFVRQFALTDAAWFNTQPWPHVRGWLEAWWSSALFASVMLKYPPWRPGDTPTLFACAGQAGVVLPR